MTHRDQFDRWLLWAVWGFAAWPELTGRPIVLPSPDKPDTSRLPNHGFRVQGMQAQPSTSRR